MEPAYAILAENGKMLSTNADKMGLTTSMLSNTKLWGTPKGAANNLRRLQELENNPNWAWFGATPSKWQVITIHARIVK